MCRKLTEIRFRDDASWVIIDLNGRSTYTPAVISVGNNLLCAIHHSFFGFSPPPPLGNLWISNCNLLPRNIIYIINNEEVCYMWWDDDISCQFQKWVISYLKEPNYYGWYIDNQDIIKSYTCDVLFILFPDLIGILLELKVYLMQYVIVLTSILCPSILIHHAPTAILIAYI